MRSLLVFLALLFSPAAFAEKQQAVFAGGCFWCMESDMGAIPGVISVESGYTGGALKNPTYEDVLTERTGHYEAVRVTFDTDKITYEQLLSRYWPLVDPTDAGGQFCDRGLAYTTAVWVRTEAERKAAAASRKAAAARLKTGKMETPVLRFSSFWPAEAYHQDYAAQHPLRYNLYRQGCGRDRRLRAVWGR